MDVELRHLRYFVAVAEALHFGRAAERLVVSQPALSRQIRDVERELGVALFTRTSRQVRLTRPGELFLEQARLTLAQAARAVDVARRAGRGEIGELTIGFLGSVAARLLPAIVRSFRAEHPDVGLRFYEALDEKQLAGIADRHLDVGFVRSASDVGDVRLEPIVREPLCAVVPADHAVAQRRSVVLDELAGQSFILWPRQLSPVVYDEIIAACRQRGFTPRIELESAGAIGTVSLVAAGLGASILTASYLDLVPSTVAFVPIDGLASTLYLAWRDDNPSTVLPSFLDVARRQAAPSEPRNSSCE